MITYTWWQSDTSDDYVLHIPDNNLIEVDNNLTDTLKTISHSWWSPQMPDGDLKHSMMTSQPHENLTHLMKTSHTY